MKKILKIFKYPSAVMVSLLTLVAIWNAKSPLSAYQTPVNLTVYQINKIDPLASTADYIECGSVHLDSESLIIAGAINDSGKPKAELTNLGIRLTDTYNNMGSSVCFSTCPLNHSTINFALNDCLQVLRSSACAVFQGMPITVRVSQSINCNLKTVTRNKQVSGKFWYSSCENRGYVQFTLDPWDGYRCCGVKYTIWFSAKKMTGTGPDNCN